MTDHHITLTGGPGNDDLRGYGGDDVLTAGAGDDRLAGMAGIDLLDGGPGDDTSYGGAGNDQQTGGAGNDRLYGGPGDDRLNGGAGDDLISGGPGEDQLTGGEGADTFRFVRGHSSGGGDVILDFNPGAGDRILLSGFSSGKLRLSDVIDADGDGARDDREITLPGGGIITLRDVDDAELALENIITLPSDDAALLALLTGGDTDPERELTPLEQLLQLANEPVDGGDTGGGDTGAEQTPPRQGAIVIEIPFSISGGLSDHPLPTDFYARDARLAFYGPNADTFIFLRARFNYDEYGSTPLSVKNYQYHDLFNGGTQQQRATFRYFDNLKSGLEAALESLPNIATAEVITLAADHWRIALTEGPGGLSHFTYNITLGRFAYEHEGIKWGGGYYASANSPHFIELPQQSGAAQLFTFDGATSDGLTPGARAAFDLALAEGDGATDGATADPPAAPWQMGLEGAFDGNPLHDYIGA